MLSLRITSGTAKDKKLKTPEIEGYRATQEKAKLAIFSILGERVKGAHCLDLYAGSGNLGLEALSRGAATCDFVDEGRPSEQAIRENLRICGFEDRANVYKQDVIKFVGNATEKYDIVFADPFYKDTHFRFLFQLLEEILIPNGVVVFSHGKDTDINDALTNAPNLELYETRKYGVAYISYIKKKIS